VRKATYNFVDQGPTVVEYDEGAPCWMCGKPVLLASMGGTVICPWCDTGYNRDGTKRTFKECMAAGKRYRQNAREQVAQ